MYGHVTYAVSKETLQPPQGPSGHLEIETQGITTWLMDPFRKLIGNAGCKCSRFGFPPLPPPWGPTLRGWLNPGLFWYQNVLSINLENLKIIGIAHFWPKLDHYKYYGK